MAQIFCFSADLPPDCGFPLFGGFHLAALALILTLCLKIGRISRRTPGLSRILSRYMALSEILRLLILAKIGHLTVDVLPLHLCSLAVWLCVVYAVRPIRWVGQVLYTLCLPGAVSALLFPDWTVYPPYSYFCLHAFAVHSAAVLFILLELKRGYIRPSWHLAYQPILFLSILVPVLSCFNRMFHTNYLFLTEPSRGSPLIFLSSLPLGYRTSYLIGLVCLIGLMLWIWHLAHRHRSAHKPSDDCPEP